MSHIIFRITRMQKVQGYKGKVRDRNNEYHEEADAVYSRNKITTRKSTFQLMSKVDHRLFR